MNKEAVRILKEKMEEHLRIAKIRGFGDKVMRLTTEEIEIIVEKLSE